MPGLDGVFVGPTDLAVSMEDAPRELPSVRHERATRQIAEACQERNLLAGIYCIESDRAARYRSMGYHLLAVQSDVRMLSNYAQVMLQDLRSEDRET